MAGSCLHLSDIEIKRSGRTILNIDNLQIASGKFVGVIGTNGAGKTTLLKVCCGLIKPSRGIIKLDDTDWAGSGNYGQNKCKTFIFPAEPGGL